MNWTVHVARVGGLINSYNIFMKNRRERDHFEELGTEAKMDIKVMELEYMNYIRVGLL